MGRRLLLASICLPVALAACGSSGGSTGTGGTGPGTGGTGYRR